MKRQQTRLACLVLFVACLPSAGTTLIVKQDGSHILLAADTRQGITITDSSTQYQDGSCKVYAAGKSSLYSVSGHETHSHIGTSGVVVDWSGIRDAQTAFISSGGNIVRFAKEWGSLVREHIRDYAQHDPSGFLRDMKGAEDQNILGGLFAGWIFGSPVVKAEMVSYVETPMGVRLDLSDYDIKLPLLSTNKITEELIKGETPRAKEVANRWKSESLRYPLGERSWRYLQFLVKQTNAFDQTVSTGSDIAEITFSGRIVWLSRTACH